MLSCSGITQEEMRHGHEGATAYLLNQLPEVRESHTNAEYAELRDRFIKLLSECMARPTSDC